MPRSFRALAAVAALAVLTCVAATLAAHRLHLGALSSTIFVGAIALGYALCALGLARRQEHSARVDAEDLRAFDEQLAGSGSEAESHALVLAHLRRMLPTADPVILAHRDSDALLTPVHDDRMAATPLGRLLTRRPTAQACSAIRQGYPVERGFDARSPVPDGHCELCDGVRGEVACEPLRTGTQTVGTLLVTDAHLAAPARALVREVAHRAAPVLAAHRRLEATERRAGTDPLTELANRRAAERELRRLSAQAGRSVSPLGVILIELDAAPSDGGRAAEATLLVVARALAAGIRASDFLARHGDQSFLVLTPDTDRNGGAELAEKLRRELEELTIPKAATSLTASLGVASVPMDALEPEELMRQAGRALATAQALGGNQVREAEPTAAP